MVFLNDQKPKNLVKVPINGEDILCRIGKSDGEIIYYVFGSYTQFTHNERICEEKIRGLETFNVFMNSEQQESDMKPVYRNNRA